ncbi:MAG: hypothetical protein OXE86_20605 [Alphaproteobacteria bacterium]|nr:hypothetical protein [Alphaproteobacteria bacterium]
MRFNRQRQTSYFGPSTLVRVTEVNAEQNTLSGVVAGGLHNGTPITDMGCAGKTKPAALAQKGMSYIDPADIEAGSAYLVVDGLRRAADGRFTSRWMRTAGEEPVFSTPEAPLWMAVVPFRSEWPQDGTQKVGVTTVDIGAGVQARTLDELRDGFIAAASRDDGYGRVVVAVLHADGPEAGRDTMTLPGPSRGEDGKPSASPEERYDAFIAKLGGAEQVSVGLEAGHTVSVAPASMRLLSRYETQAMEKSDSLRRFAAPTHGAKLSAALDRLSGVPGARARAEGDYAQWSNGGELAKGSNRDVAAWARERDVHLPFIGQRGHLPASYGLVGPDHPGEAPALVKRLVQTAVPVPESAMPMPGDLKSVQRFHNMYEEAAEAIATGPALAATAEADARVSGDIAEPEVPEQEQAAAVDEQVDVEAFDDADLDPELEDSFAQILGLDPDDDAEPAEKEEQLPAPAPDL